MIINTKYYSCSQIHLNFKSSDNSQQAIALLFLPKTDIKGIFVAYNFHGNQSLLSNEKITISPGITQQYLELPKNSEPAVMKHRWPIELLTSRGYALFSMCYKDIEPDDAKKGERQEVMNRVFPHWFNKNFRQYDDKEENSPFDQHMLLSLMAPRPLYLASASEDLWADPKGEFLAIKECEKVYKLLGATSYLPKTFPSTNSVTTTGHLAYHLRDGAHNILLYDWKYFLDFTDNYLKTYIKGIKPGLKLCDPFY